MGIRRPQSRRYIGKSVGVAIICLWLFSGVCKLSAGGRCLQADLARDSIGVAISCLWLFDSIRKLSAGREAYKQIWQGNYWWSYCSSRLSFIRIHFSVGNYSVALLFFSFSSSFRGLAAFLKTRNWAREFRAAKRREIGIQEGRPSWDAGRCRRRQRAMSTPC